MTVWPGEKPMYEGIAAGGVKLVDLSRECNDGIREIFVLPIASHGLAASDTDLLVRHARVTGYHRIWLGDGLGVVDLPGLVPFGCEATISCDRCGWTGIESTPAFWTAVADHNDFPRSCVACGQPVAAWSVDEARSDEFESAPSDLFEPSWDGEPEHPGSLDDGLGDEFDDGMAQ